MWNTHIVGGLAMGAAVAPALLREDLHTKPITIAWFAAAIAISAAGSLVPDIDCKTSKLGGKTKLFSSLLQFIFGHRALFHAPILYLAPILWLDTTSKISYPISVLAFSFLFGALSHIFLDAFNPAGIAVFYPFWNKRYRFAKIASNQKIESFFRLFLIALFIAILIINVLTFLGITT